jgi:hypothetical protein
MSYSTIGFGAVVKALTRAFGNAGDLTPVSQRFRHINRARECAGSGSTGAIPEPQLTRASRARSG